MYFGFKLFTRQVFCKYFLSICVLYFINSVIQRDLLNFYELQHIYIFLPFKVCTFCKLRNLCLIQGHKIFSKFSSKVFIVLLLTLMSMIYFEGFLFCFVFFFVMYNLSVGHSNPLLYSCLENSRDRGAWWAVIHEVQKSWT